LRNYIASEIARILLKKSNEKHLIKAKLLNSKKEIKSLNLRDLELNTADIISIANLFKVENEANNCSIKSLSLSYNKQIGNDGAIALSEHLPKSLCELGFVDCGISDNGGNAILKQLKKLPNLEMICIEGNNFSETLKNEFYKFKQNNPRIVIVF